MDFTSSNGDPNTPESLHCIKNLNNSYRQAIKAVGEILINYDHDKIVPSFGFGGSFKDKLSHCFPLSGNNPNVLGVEGIL